MELFFDGKNRDSSVSRDIGTLTPLYLEDDSSYVISGDNSVAMSRILCHKKAFIDLVYIDPPYNTNQIFSVSTGRANTISRENNGVVAYNDVMKSNDYIKFMYDRLVMIYELMSEKGSIYVHVDTKIGHYIKIILDEIFGVSNFINDITRIKANPKNFGRKAYGNEKDMILFYVKNKSSYIWNNIKYTLSQAEINKNYSKTDVDGRKYTTIPLHAPGETKDGITGQPWRGMLPPKGRHWRTNPIEFDKMDENGLIEWSKNGNPRIKKYADEHGGKKVQDVWVYKDPQNPIYPTQKNIDMLKFIISQSSNDDSVVMDCFAGSGTTLLAAASMKRKFIGVDSSKVAVDIIKSRLDTDSIPFQFIAL